MLTAQTALAFTSATLTSTFNDNKFGGVIGAGYEWMMAPNRTLRGEYLFYGFRGSNANTLSTVCGGGLAPATANACGAAVALSQNYLSVFRGGANYKF
jgi:opacity protein-like surface antigen